MQIIVAGFGRAIELELKWRGKQDDDDAETVTLDGPRLELADDDEQLPFGFTLQCPGR